MWSNVLNRVEELKNIDRNKVVFGANSHNYRAGSKLTLNLINKFEKEFGANIPEQLKSFYMEVGNGGFGPDYGLRPIEKIVPYNPDNKWQGIDFYLETESEYEDVASGMLGIMDRYYAHESCIVTNGEDKGSIIEFCPQEGWIFIGANDLISLFNTWLDKELEWFNIFKRLILKHNKIEIIASELNCKYGLDHQNAITRIASMLGFPFKYWPDARESLIFNQITNTECDVYLNKPVIKLFNDKIHRYLSDNKSLTISPTQKKYTFMNFLAVDVDYRADNAFVAGVAFSDWGEDVRRYKTKVEGVEDYVSGEFYKRELPCILELLREHDLHPDCIIVDGYVYLEGGKLGLGKYLFDSLGGEIKVIGVAKNPRGVMPEKHEVFRGKSSQPLFVTSEGIELEVAKNIVKSMDGPYRIPTKLKLVDTYSREK